MRVYPFDEVCREAKAHADAGLYVFQQFNCAHCGTKQTIDKPNQFHTSGICEECGKETDIEKDGCNYMLIGTPLKFTS